MNGKPTYAEGDRVAVIGNDSHGLHHNLTVPCEGVIAEDKGYGWHSGRLWRVKGHGRYRGHVAGLLVQWVHEDDLRPAEAVEDGEADTW